MLAGSALAALILVAPKVRASIPFHTALTGNRNLLADYFEGIAFSIHLLFLLPVIHRFRSLLLKVAVITGSLASLTFAMYLFHRPLIQLFAASHSGTVSSWPTRILVLGLTFAIIATLGRWCEGQKHRIKAGLFAYFGEKKRVPAEVLT